MIRLQLPFPPTANNLFRNLPGRGRVPTKHYLTWRRAAGNQAVVQQQKRIAGPVLVSIKLGKPDRRKRDLDNAFKAILDLLTHLGLIDDDSVVQSLSIAWADVDGADVEVRPVP